MSEVLISEIIIGAIAMALLTIGVLIGRRSKEPAIAWEQPMPTAQEEIAKRTDWIGDNEAKMAIIQSYRKGPDEIKELISLEYDIYIYKKQIKRLTNGL